MGCLPLLLLFPAGFGVGYLIGGDLGGLWGAGAGLLLGVLAMVGSSRRCAGAADARRKGADPHHRIEREVRSHAVHGVSVARPIAYSGPSIGAV
ncbi:hypothetical protein EAH75_15120 [Rhodanobacter glycinis]|uniref:Uncharacterized protein n=1 Tax=Rhodanobacter glycinis TaxID=582702 RepID=A0A502CA91_9GAMM|nr:hypothetical protein EAH88_09395 [Rhodanobacter glycinis]TPG46760.1 hypothetical protein EAH75_15120 [Rhodanobacter glycinis]